MQRLDIGLLSFVDESIVASRLLLSPAMYQTFYSICCLIVMCKCSTSGASDIYYHIKPSMNALCPEEPCLTLSEFATHTGDYISYRILPSCFFLDNTTSAWRSILLQLSLTSKPTLSNSPGATIACEGNASLTFSNIAEVYIGHLRFSGCYGHKSVSVQMFVVNNSSFINHRGQRWSSFHR